MNGNGNVVNFSSGRKRSWRSWQWNRIVDCLKKVKKPVRDAVVVYLVGPFDNYNPKDFDIDRKIAIRKGFRNENIIAINNDQETIAKVRFNGGYGICGDFFEIIASWNNDPKIDVIVADLTTGINRKVLWLQHILLVNSGISPDGIISINLFRGRDKFGKMYFDRLKTMDVHHTSKNRAEIFFNNCFACWLIIRIFGKELAIIKKISIKEFLKEGALKLYKLTNIDELLLFRRHQRYLLKLSNVSFMSYRSENSKTFMDSAVFIMPIVITTQGTKLEFATKVRQKIAATKAWRTMRLEK